LSILEFDKQKSQKREEEEVNKLYTTISATEGLLKLQ